jgi:CRP/FNR family transcriptional regulator, cyclic AMP receptor protein
VIPSGEAGATQTDVTAGLPVELLDILPTIAFLRDEPPDVRAEFGRLATCRTYPRGNLLFHHGEPGDAIFLVLRGRVKVSLVNGDGREVMLALLQPGGVFGLVEALDGGPHTGTATTLLESRLARVPADRFVGWLRQRPAVHQRLLLGLTRMLREAYEKVGEQALLPVKRRLLGALLEIARSEGELHGEEVSFVLPTHQELADRVGSTRVVVSRLLKEVIEEERYRTQRGKVLRLPARALVDREEGDL